ncbi:MAG: TetR/AcrR family transcriptional regulator [Pseudomonadota bacterium]
MPRTADADARRSEIIAATQALVAEGGPEALSMRKIAARAGCTIGLINHWFASKEAIIDAVLDEVVTASIERCRVAIANDPSIPLEELVLEFLPVDAARSTEFKVWLVFWGLSLSRPELRSGYRQRMVAFRRTLRAELRRHGHDAEGIERFVDVLMTSVDGIAVNALVEPGYWTPRRQQQTISWLIERLA